MTEPKKKMDPEIKKQWTAALRSGDYTQGKTALCTDTGYCCLGVLCDLHAKAIGSKRPVKSYLDIPHSRCYLDAVSYLPEEVITCAGLTGRNPAVATTAYYKLTGLASNSVPLAVLNDHGATFNEIADFIDEQL